MNAYTNELREGSAPPRRRLTARERDSLRVANSGTRDILNLIASAESHGRVVAGATSVIDELFSIESGSAQAQAYVRECVQRFRASNNLDGDIRSILNNALHDLASLPDESLCSPMIVPKDYTPALRAREWLGAMLPVKLDGVLGINVEELANELDVLRHEDPTAWALLVSGQLKSVLRLRCDSEGFQAKFPALVRGVAIAFYALTIRVRASLLRRWSTHPMTEAFRHDREWQYQERVAMTAIIDPARQIWAALEQIINRPADDKRLAGTFLENSQILAMAERVQGNFNSGRGGTRYQGAEAKLFGLVQKRLNDMASITEVDLKAEGPAMTEFVQARLGVPASHGAVILAASLLQAAENIDAHINAIINPGASRCVSSDLVGSATYNKRLLVRVTRWVRSAAQTDRHARPSRELVDHEDKAGHKLVQRAMSSFHVAYPCVAVAVLRPDPAWWFS